MFGYVFASLRLKETTLPVPQLEAEATRIHPEKTTASIRQIVMEKSDPVADIKNNY